MDVKDFDKDLPPTTKSFILDVVGKVSRKRFVGDFTCTIANMEVQSAIAKTEANLNGQYPMYLDSGVLKLHKMYAYLKHTLIEYPKFWQESKHGIQLRDINVLESLYDTVQNFEEEWFKKIWSDPEAKDEKNPEGEINEEQDPEPNAED